ncbi:MAG: hypothetical protein ACJAX5_002835 [Patiriisocius sp.]|jgi:hypothetical protein
MKGLWDQYYPAPVQTTPRTNGSVWISYRLESLISLRPCNFSNSFDGAGWQTSQPTLTN